MAASNACLKQHAPRVDEVAVAFRDLPRVIGSGGAWEEKAVELTAPKKAKRAIADVVGGQCRVGDMVTVTWCGSTTPLSTWCTSQWLRAGRPSTWCADTGQRASTARARRWS